MKGTKPVGYTPQELRDLTPVDYGKGRVCANTECATHLSRYNPLPFCHQHEDDWYEEPCEYNDDGLRCCKMCGKWYPPSTVHWILDERMRDGLMSICRYCRRYPERVKARLAKQAQTPEEKRQHEREAARVRDQRYRDKKRAEGR